MFSKKKYYFLSFVSCLSLYQTTDLRAGKRKTEQTDEIGSFLSFKLLHQTPQTSPVSSLKKRIKTSPPPFPKESPSSAMAPQDSSLPLQTIQLPSFSEFLKESCDQTSQSSSSPRSSNFKEPQHRTLLLQEAPLPSFETFDQQENLGNSDQQFEKERDVPLTNHNFLSSNSSSFSSSQQLFSLPQDTPLSPHEWHHPSQYEDPFLEKLPSFAEIFSRDIINLHQKLKRTSEKDPDPPNQNSPSSNSSSLSLFQQSFSLPQNTQISPPQKQKQKSRKKSGKKVYPLFPFQTFFSFQPTHKKRGTGSLSPKLSEQKPSHKENQVYIIKSKLKEQGTCWHYGEFCSKPIPLKEVKFRGEGPGFPYKESHLSSEPFEKEIFF